MKKFILGLPTDDVHRVPWIGEHTDMALGEDLGLTCSELEVLRATGAIG